MVTFGAFVIAGKIEFDPEKMKIKKCIEAQKEWNSETKNCNEIQSKSNPEFEKCLQEHRNWSFKTQKCE